MWNAIGEVLKSFLEKRLMPTIIAVMLMCLGLYFTPDDFSVLVKLEKPLYALLLFTVCFIVVSLIHYLIFLVRKGVRSVREKLYYANQKKGYERDTLEQMWNFIDSLSPVEYDIIVKFLKTKNKPIQFKGIPLDSGLFTSNYVISSKIGAVTDVKPPKNDSHNVMQQIIMEQSMYKQINMYKLNPKIYNNLLYSIEHYGKICNFTSLSLKDLEEGYNI